MSEGTVKIRLKIGVNEVEIEGPTSDIEKTIGLIPAMMQALPEEMLDQSLSQPRSTFEYNRLENFSAPSQNQQPPHPTRFPEIHVEKGDSLSDIITKLFTDNWGRNPRKLGEVREVLQSYGQVYPKQSVAVALLRLAQSGRLRRFKSDDGEFVYTASTNLAVEEAGRIAQIRT